jgi:hypothetical protein
MRTRRVGLIVVMLGVITGSCNLINKKKEESSVSATNKIPADWDLKSDWKGGVWYLESAE